jgi:alpha-ribazole phosphatase
MTELILIRHGQTQWNIKGRYQGHTDIELSEIGIEQAIRLKEKLKNKKIDYFYSSDLTRAYVTAKIVAENHNKPLVICEELKEMGFGVWEGLTYQEIMVNHQELANKWYKNPLSAAIPDAESFYAIEKRVMAKIQALLKEHKEKTIAVFTHGGIIRIIILALMKWDYDSFWNISQDNTAINILNIYDNRVVLKVLNDTCHLD